VSALRGRLVQDGDGYKLCSPYRAHLLPVRLRRSAMEWLDERFDPDDTRATGAQEADGTVAVATLSIAGGHDGYKGAEPKTRGRWNYWSQLYDPECLAERPLPTPAHLGLESMLEGAL